MSSVSIVPAGLTKYRDKLYPLTDFTKEEADSVIELVNSFGEEHKKKYGTRLFYVSDEFYLKAEREIPTADYYEDYPQIENGVGMIRSLLDEFGLGITDLEGLSKIRKKKRRVSIATGVSAYPYVRSLCERLTDICPRLTVNVYKIVNNFFGESITVSGLLTGKDISEQLLGKELFDELLIPQNALRSGEDIFLCGMTVSELSKKLSVKVTPSGADGYELCLAILGENLT